MQQNLQQGLLEKYFQTRSKTIGLMEPLGLEDYLAQPSEEVSPPKWHLGHTTWFFETLVLKEFLSNYHIYNDKFSYYFNSYYEGLGDRIDRNSRGTLIRPPLNEVFAYRTYVDEQMKLLLEKDLDKSALELIELGINHEQQHQELFLTDFKKILATQPFQPAYQENFKESFSYKKQKAEWISLDSDIYQIGHQGSTFSFDNERPRHKVYLEPFAISSQLVSNGEWLDFIEDSGYQDFQHWHSEGWDWINREKIKAPLYWFQKGQDWYRYSLAGPVKVNRQESVAHISFYEAYAFAEWKGLRLPTEEEWEVSQKLFNWGERWEWTNSAYLPYPGFKATSGPAKEYNGKFMVNQMVLRGASIASPKGHSRYSYRNFFHAHFRWQFSGIRLAKNI